MEPVDDATLRRMVAQLASHPWEDRQLEELVAPKFGIITGFQALLKELDALRRVDLGEIGPAAAIRHKERS